MLLYKYLRCDNRKHYKGYVLLFAMNKKGQGQVIEVILLVLIVIVLIVVLWNLFQNLVVSETSKIGIEKFKTTLYVESVKLFADGETQIKVKKNSGDAEISQIKFIFYNRNGETQVITKDAGEIEIPKELETVNVQFSREDIMMSSNEIEKISVLPVLKDDLGIEAFG